MECTSYPAKNRKLLVLFVTTHGRRPEPEKTTCWKNTAKINSQASNSTAVVNTTHNCNNDIDDIQFVMQKCNDKL